MSVFSLVCAIAALALTGFSIVVAATMPKGFLFNKSSYIWALALAAIWIVVAILNNIEALTSDT